MTQKTMMMKSKQRKMMIQRYLTRKRAFQVKERQRGRTHSILQNLLNLLNPPNLANPMKVMRRNHRRWGGRKTKEFPFVQM